MFLKTKTMAHAYNPSYSGARDLEDHSSRPPEAKKLARPHLNQ
jgi:hypothetical protein